MSPIKRRQFLQFAGSLLATLGLNPLQIQRQGDRYGKVLAQGTPRKLALLVGINEYYPESGFSPLKGCVTDVELQRQLLVHRFGFNPVDVLTLTDTQSTRNGILTAFEEHLIKQAKPGDVVVFHFSGHGSQVRDPDGDFSDGLNSTFVPVDSSLPPEFPFEGGIVQDIMGHTLFLLMAALSTENVTVVLDSCHSGGGTRGNLRVRSPAGIDLARSSGIALEASPAEFEYQQQWLSQLNLSPEEYIQRRRAGVAKGVVVASTKRNQLAADAPFSDFFAGAFTYLMTQYLWQQTGSKPFVSALPSIARSTTQLSFSNQEPQYEIKPGSQDDRQPFYFLDRPTPPAEAVVTQVQGDRAELWLGGLDPQSLAAFNQGAVLAAVDEAGEEQGLVQLESRDGLVAQGTLLQALQPGALLQEQVRGIPSNLTLKIGLDPSLGDDREAAKSAIGAIARLEALPLQQEEVQYILGRMTPELHLDWQEEGVSNLPPMGTVGLFSPALERIPGSFGPPEESIADAVRRLRSKFQSLLAARLVKLTLNTNSSRLNVSASMAVAGQPNQAMAESFTVRGSSQRQTSATAADRILQLPLGTSIQLQLKNDEARSLYFSVLAIDPVGDMVVLFPNQWTAAEDASQVEAGQTLLVPDPEIDSFALVTQEPKGVTDLLILASASPLRQALQALRRLASQNRGPVVLEEPTAVMEALLFDLGGGDRGTSDTSPSIRPMDTTQLAALSISFEVI